MIFSQHERYHASQAALGSGARHPNLINWRDMMIKVNFGNSEYEIECDVVIEGNQWCVMMCNSDFATMPCGFGYTINEAIADFRSEIRNTMPPKSKAKS